MAVAARPWTRNAPGVERRRYRLFAPSGPGSSFRRAGDVVTLAVAAALLALLLPVVVPPARLELEALQSARSLPSVLDGFFRVLLGLLATTAALTAAVAALRRRWMLLRDIFVGLLISAGLALLVARVVQGSWEVAWYLPPQLGEGRWQPWFRLAGPIAVILIASPYLAAPVRRIGRWLVTLGAFAAVLSGALAPTQGLASVLIAIVAAATVHLVFGSPSGWPDLEDVPAALAALGVETGALGAADRQRAGVFVLKAAAGDGTPMTVKVYGRDAYDTQLLTTVWRTIWFRDADAPISPGRLQQVEHEAVLTLLAAQAGVLTQPIVTAGLAPNDDAIIVLGGTPAHDGSGDWDESTAHSLWQALALLQTARIAHGQVDEAHLVFDGERVGLSDFRSASVASDDLRLRIDRAQALVTTVLALGTETAVRVAEEELGAERLAEVLPLVQLDPLTPAQRSSLRAAARDVDEIREEAAAAIGVAAPELWKLRRFTWASALRAALPVAAFLALSSVLAGLDLDGVGETLSEASPWLLGLGFALAQLPRLPQALSVLGASPMPVPLARLYLLQLAQSFVALTVPGAAGRIALNVRFLQRHGLPSGSALAVGAIDGLGGFIGQALLLTGILSFTSASLGLELDGDTTAGLGRLVIVVVGAALAAAVVLLAVPAWRRPLAERARALGAEALSAASGLASPRRLGLLFGGSIATEVLWAVALGACALALGYPVGLPELVLIHVAVSLLAGVLPVPGGIGVVEGGLTFGLARAGLPEDAAFAAALMFRAFTYYLPPIWGFVALRWLERAKHL